MRTVFVTINLASYYTRTYTASCMIEILTSSIDFFVVELFKKALTSTFCWMLPACFCFPFGDVLWQSGQPPILGRGIHMWQ